jgi:hypothetical protein
MKGGEERERKEKGEEDIQIISDLNALHPIMGEGMRKGDGQLSGLVGDHQNAEGLTFRRFYPD